MKNRFRTLLLVLLAVLLFVTPVAAGEKVAYDTYTYTYDGDPIASPHAYTPAHIIRMTDLGQTPLSDPGDLCVGADGRIYVADTGNSRIVVLNADETVAKIIDTFTYGGEEQTFGKPKGVYVTPDGALYVADTENRRIVVFSSDYVCTQIVVQPTSTVLPKDFSFLPIRVAVDNAGRMYCVSSGNIYGVVALNSAGGFETFIGAQKVTPNLSERFWRMFMTKEQRKRTKKTVPTNYNSIAIDEKGFLYVTSSYSNTAAVMQAVMSRSTDNRYAMIKKLTPSGEDVLLRNGFFPPAGDVRVQLSSSGNEVNTDIRYGPSVIADVALGDNGVYSLMDQKRGKIFTYDTDGNLLYAFGGTGYQPGMFQQLVAIDYSDTVLYALDGVNGQITRFAQTAYGAKVQKAIALTEARQYDASVEVYREILRENNGFDMANIGIAGAMIRQGKYEAAMEYYKTANDVSGYSKAYSLHRKAVFGDYLLLVPVLLAAVVFGLSQFFKWTRRVNARVAAGGTGERTVGQELVYMFHVMFHPFDGFWDLKRAKRGGVRGAAIILAVVALVMAIREVGTGYIYSGEAVSDSNVLLVMAVFFGVVLLWCVANWCLTTLMSGEGSFKDIFVATAYALPPVALTMLPAVIVSHFVTEQEIMFVNFITVVGFLWAAILLFAAVMSTHAYTPGKNVLTILCTLVGMLLIAFLLVLFVNLIARMFTFGQNVYNEVIFRT